MALWGVGVMVGPILGPTLGGWLTESYSWRWVFYVNVPVGILTVLGLLTFLRETRAGRDMPFDWFGFVTLSVAIGALQLMLDRGEQLDWFGSTEIMAEAAIAGTRLLSVPRPHLHRRAAVREPAAVRRPQFRRPASCFIFLVGIILLATLALLTPVPAEPDGLSRCSPPAWCWRRAAWAPC